MPKTTQKATILPMVLSLLSLVLLPALFYAALANVTPINTAPGVFAVAGIPMVIGFAALVVNKGNTKHHTTSIILAIMSLVLSSIVQLFFVGSAILWSAG